MSVIDRFGGALLAGTWDESLHPRDERGRFGEGTGSPVAIADRPVEPYADAAARRQAAVERIVAAMPNLAEPGRLKIQGMDPDHAETLAWRVETFAKNFPDLKIGGITLEPPGPGTMVGRNLGVVMGGTVYLNGDPKYFGEMPPPPQPPDPTTARPGDPEYRAFQTGMRELQAWARLESDHERFAQWTDNEGKSSPKAGQSTFSPLDGAQSTIDHEFGHIIYRAAENATGWSGATMTRWALDMPHITGWDVKTEAEFEPMPVRAVTRAFREMGSEYGARSFTSPEPSIVPGSYYGPSHDLNEGFADWFSMYQAGLPTETRTPPMLEAAFQRVVSAARDPHGFIPRARQPGGGS